MSREIKFRAWDKSNKRMFEVYGVGKDFVTENTLDGPDDAVNCFHGDSFFENIVLQQYTGLKDKNGKEIFEGDITEHKGRRWKVFWHQECASFWAELIKGEDEFVKLGHHFEVTTWAEVIGNIYENPELTE